MHCGVVIKAVSGEWETPAPWLGGGLRALAPGLASFRYEAFVLGQHGAKWGRL